MDTTRLEAFSDGVFAIAATLLVLGIAVPPATEALGPGLLRLWPSYVAYLVSFLVIGAIWINHTAMFEHVHHADGALLLLNLLQLMDVAFLPFPTAVLAEAYRRGADEPLAAAFYGGTLTLLGIFVYGTWRYAARGDGLLHDRVTPNHARQIERRYLIGPVSYAVGTVVALFVPWVAVLIYAMINIFYLWPRRDHAHV